MVGAHPSMPDTLDGCGKCVVPGHDHKSTKRVERREVVHLPLNKQVRVFGLVALCYQWEQEEAEGARDVA